MSSCIWDLLSLRSSTPRGEIQPQFKSRFREPPDSGQNCPWSPLMVWQMRKFFLTAQPPMNSLQWGSWTIRCIQALRRVGNLSNRIGLLHCWTAFWVHESPWSYKPGPANKVVTLSWNFRSHQSTKWYTWGNVACSLIPGSKRKMKQQINVPFSLTKCEAQDSSPTILDSKLFFQIGKIALRSSHSSAWWDPNH